MIRGVNKQIVEVLNTENDYFDKAILFVKPEKQDIGKKKLSKEANRYIQNVKQENVQKTKINKYIIQAAKILGFMATGGAIAVCIFR